MIFRLTGVVLGLSLLASSGFPQEQEESQEKPRNVVQVPEGDVVPDALMTRVESYWQAKTDKQLEKMYPLYTPEYRESHDLEKFTEDNQRLVAVKIHSFEAKNVVFEDEEHSKARVRILYVTEPKIFPGLYQALKEDRWTKVDDEWYMVFEEFQTPFAPRPKQ